MSENDFIGSPNFEYNNKVAKIKRKAMLNSNLSVGILYSVFKYMEKNRNEDLLKCIEDNAFDRKQHSFLLALGFHFKYSVIKCINWIDDRKEMVTAVILIGISFALNIVLLFILLGLVNVS